jgi:hypothetical protein
VKEAEDQDKRPARPDWSRGLRYMRSHLQQRHIIFNESGAQDEQLNYGRKCSLAWYGTLQYSVCHGTVHR